MKSKFNYLLICFMVTPFIFIVFSSQSTQSSEDILKKADFVLIPQNCKLKMDMIIQREDEEDQKNTFLVYKKGDLKYLLFSLHPESSYGQAHLRIDSTIWMYFPLADDTVKTSYRSAFLGSGLSYADVMYNELVRYYDTKIVDESYEYKDSNAQYTKDVVLPLKCWILELKVKKGAEGYAKLLVYIDKKTYVTLKREYFSLSGDKIKEIFFLDYVFSKSNVVSFKMDINDFVNAKVKTLAYFYKITSQEVAEKYFSLNFIKTFQPSPNE